MQSSRHLLRPPRRGFSYGRDRCFDIYEVHASYATNTLRDVKLLCSQSENTFVNVTIH